jgi:hypothetical protein
MFTENLQQVTAERGVSFIDLTDILGKIKEDAFADDCHLTPLIVASTSPESENRRP